MNNKGNKGNKINKDNQDNHNGNPSRDLNTSYKAVRVLLKVSKSCAEKLLEISQRERNITQKILVEKEHQRMFEPFLLVGFNDPIYINFAVPILNQSGIVLYLSRNYKDEFFITNLAYITNLSTQSFFLSSPKSLIGSLLVEEKRTTHPIYLEIPELLEDSEVLEITAANISEYKPQMIRWNPDMFADLARTLDYIGHAVAFYELYTDVPHNMSMLEYNMILTSISKAIRKISESKGESTIDSIRRQLGAVDAKFTLPEGSDVAYEMQDFQYGSVRYNGKTGEVDVANSANITNNDGTTEDNTSEVFKPDNIYKGYKVKKIGIRPIGYKPISFSEKMQKRKPEEYKPKPFQSNMDEIVNKYFHDNKFPKHPKGDSSDWTDTYFLGASPAPSSFADSSDIDIDKDVDNNVNDSDINQ